MKVLSIKNIVKSILKLSPIPLSKNHLYDQQTKKIISTLKENSNCIDVGCFKGEILDLLLKASPKGHHFAFEPIPTQFDYLLKKYKNYTNVTLSNKAASNTEGTSQFNYVISNPPYSGLKKRDYDHSDEKDTLIDVSTIRIDDVIGPEIQIDLIKIDVEGAEYLVLQGAKELIKKYRPIIIFEFGKGASNHYGTTPMMMSDFFEECSMVISNLGAFSNQENTLSSHQFYEQYHHRTHYYFVAHKAR